MGNRYKKYNILEHKIFLASMILLLFILGVILLVGQNTGSWLSPSGVIASQQKMLLFYSAGLMLFVLFPILGFAFYVAYKYRADTDSKIPYKPKWDSDPKLTALKFSVPIAVIAILSFVVWNTSHRLDPFRSIASTNKPLTIQVVALNWKWLFIYPDQKIATVNYVEFPENTPVDFVLTSDGPMNSFWIPTLGGQMYAMTGMQTHLNLMASKSGEYVGSAAEINGKGFSGMRFPAKSVSDSEFALWVSKVRQEPRALTQSEYERIAAPSENNPPVFYSSIENNLFSEIMNKYMAPHDAPESVPEHMHM